VHQPLLVLLQHLQLLQLMLLIINSMMLLLCSSLQHNIHLMLSLLSLNQRSLDIVMLSWPLQLLCL
jgi:hypothetical protein